ncbi:hypothetical protein [Peristeroidobacter soli]|uniref:hypothetical protein n=1 Tax=Peristeroidobacter soli TaxID=2497877 RepID=UPI00101D06C6|nr:hypothetical protein [Peristeroidobacter soli]
MLWAAATLVALVVLYFGSRAWIGEPGLNVVPNPTFDLVIAAPQPDEAMTVLPVRQSETVTLRIRSDRAGEVHVHGYDQNVVVVAGAEVVLTFVAKTAGIYPIHLHERANPADPDSPMAHRQLAVLDVKAQ